MMKSKKRLIIDGEVLVMPHFSGVGHYTLEMIKAIDRQLDTRDDFTATLLVHFRHVDKAQGYKFKHIEVLPTPFSLRIANGLKIRNKQPYLDLLFGKGIYIFPNFTSWPLLFSKNVPYTISYLHFSILLISISDNSNFPNLFGFSLLMPVQHKVS